jgi:hypothetical protein
MGYLRIEDLITLHHTDYLAISMCKDNEEIKRRNIKEHLRQQSKEFAQWRQALHIRVIFDNNILINNNSYMINHFRYLPAVNVDIQVITKKNEVIKPMKKNAYLILIIMLQNSIPIIAAISTSCTIAIKARNVVGQNRCHWLRFG